MKKKNIIIIVLLVIIAILILSVGFGLGINKNKERGEQNKLAENDLVENNLQENGLGESVDKKLVGMHIRSGLGEGEFIFYNYDEMGRVETREYFGDVYFLDDKVYLIDNFEYNDKNQLIEIFNTNYNFPRESFYYNDRGLLEMHAEKNFRGHPTYYYWEYNNLNQVVSFKEEYKERVLHDVTYQYNDQGELSKVVLIDDDKEFVYEPEGSANTNDKTAKRYYDLALEKKFTMYHPLVISEATETVDVVDTYGNVIYSIYLGDDFSSVSYTQDDFGDILEINTEDTTYEFYYSDNHEIVEMLNNIQLILKNNFMK